MYSLVGKSTQYSGYKGTFQQSIDNNKEKSRQFGMVDSCLHFLLDRRPKYYKFQKFVQEKWLWELISEFTFNLDII